MRRKPRALIPWFPGTNCHDETAYALRKAGANPMIRTIEQLRQRPRSLCETDLIGLAGGFSDGDHFGSGRLPAMELCLRFRDQLLEALERKIPIIGICNGFQKLVAMGLLPGAAGLGNPTAVLDFNSSGRFEHRHSVKLVLHRSIGCVWTQDLDGMEIEVPVGHGEGKLRVMNGEVLVTATYGTPQGVADFPISPNGSPIAGICDPRGLIMGMMPHPERRVDVIHGNADGLLIFQSGVNAVR